jgi:hypothetical protein
LRLKEIFVSLELLSVSIGVVRQIPDEKLDQIKDGARQKIDEIIEKSLKES